MRIHFAWPIVGAKVIVDVSTPRASFKCPQDIDYREGKSLEADREITQLLKDIRDVQQTLLTEYLRSRRLAAISNDVAVASRKEGLANQVEALSRQALAIDMARKNSRLYRSVLVVAGSVITLGLFVLSRLLFSGP